MVYKRVKVNITEQQLNKAIAGKPVKFSHSQFGNGNSYLSLHPANVKQVEKSVMKGCGCVITISPGELLATAEDMQGKGFFSNIWKGLKSGYNWVKKNVIDSDIYQHALKPLVKQGINAAVQGANAFVPGASVALQPIADTIGKETGAFGMKRMTKAQKKQVLAGKGLYLS